jgi:hypothetical protein
MIFSQYSYLAFIFVLILHFALFFYLYLAQKMHKAEPIKRPIWHYILIWPLILDEFEATSKKDVGLNRRVIVGWFIALVLALCGVFIFPLHR